MRKMELQLSKFYFRPQQTIFIVIITVKLGIPI